MKVQVYAHFLEWKNARDQAAGPKYEHESGYHYNARGIQILQTVPMFRASESYRESAGHDTYGIICPACGVQGELPIAPANREHVWTISGAPDAVTLHPSVLCPCGKPGGHFWVENGQYRQA